MFSKHEGHLVYRERLEIRVKKNGTYSYITLLDYLTSTNWMDYNTIKAFLLGDDKNISASPMFRYLVQMTKYGEITKEEYTVENIQANPTEALFLIKYMKSYGSTQLVPDYLNSVYYIELVSETQFADNDCTTSIEFLYHDITHAVNSLYVCSLMNIDINEVKEFYTFLEQQFKSKNLPKDEFDKIRVFIYYEIHEGSCFLRTQKDSSIEYKKDYYRLFHFGDLLGLVPGLVRNAKKIREDKYIIPIEEIDEADINKAKEYFRTGRELYNVYLEEWKKMKAEIEEPPRKHRRFSGGKFRKKTKKMRKWSKKCKSRR